ncbi:hypothetical protein ANCCEY_03284 [Ancylostoma ceylanicum]|uniref:Uncharacterized protein n=1 Tax=Ancylostoma ceylanicum TaxID=53326 RepID=A0A0D6MBC9_9BILA|nr:hypothetical protein ANCCEY_03284 [Ancylostoma ceylanicum]
MQTLYFLALVALCIVAVAGQFYGGFHRPYGGYGPYGRPFGPYGGMRPYGPYGSPYGGGFGRPFFG